MAFTPIYRISNGFLRSFEQIAVLSAALNRRAVPGRVLVELEHRSNTLSAHASTKIEGNPLALTDVKQLLRSLPRELGPVEREVVNYNQALVELKRLLREDKPALSLKFILKLHRLVMKDLIAGPSCGRLREESVVVRNPRTGKPLYVPPDARDVRPLLEECLAYLKASADDVHPLILAGLFHRQFIVIYPFVDGNGRTAQLATWVLLAALGIDAYPLFSFENFHCTNIPRYIEHVGAQGNFYDIQESLDFTAWLEYFAEGILDELGRVSRELELASATPLNTPQPHHQLILQHLRDSGFITDRDYSMLTKRAKATRALDFKHLIALGLIERLGRGRNTYYKLKA